MINYRRGSYSSLPPSRNTKSYGGKGMNGYSRETTEKQMVSIPLEEYTKLTRDSAELEFLKRAEKKESVANNLNIGKHQIKPTKNTHTTIDWSDVYDFSNRYTSILQGK